MSDNDRKLQQQVLAQTIEKMRGELAYMEQLQIKQVPFNDYRVLVEGFVDMAETLLEQFRSFDVAHARIQELQSQLQTLMTPDISTNNPTLN